MNTDDFRIVSLELVGWVEATKPNSTVCCVGLSDSETQPTIVDNLKGRQASRKPHEVSFFADTSPQRFTILTDL